MTFLCFHLAPKPEHTVAEILHSKSVTPREKNSEATAEEKRRRREERERQREEQRLRREQRRLERELAKAKRIQTQVSGKRFIVQYVMVSSLATMC